MLRATFFVSFLYIGGCGEGLAYQNLPPATERGRTPEGNIEVIANTQKFYDPSVWRFRVDGGWVYVVAVGGSSSTLFVSDRKVP